jgi:putative transposase
MIATAIQSLSSLIGTKAACRAAGWSRATHYRRRRPERSPSPKPAPRPQPRGLSAEERATVLEALHSPRFVDAAPATVYATLLDEGTYLASVPTMYRLLRAQGETRERRRQASHPASKRPELIADTPNAIWSWDIVRHEAP